jgi:hypothetical protein
MEVGVQWRERVPMLAVHVAVPEYISLMGLVAGVGAGYEADFYSHHLVAISRAQPCKLSLYIERRT